MNRYIANEWTEYPEWTWPWRLIALHRECEALTDPMWGGDGDPRLQVETENERKE